MENKFFKLLDDILKNIDELDGETTWQVVPEWWLDMMELRKKAQQIKNKYDND